MTRTRPDTAFTAALILALALHAAILVWPDLDFLRERPRPDPLSLDVLLVESAAQTPPDEADFLAPVASQGGGEAPARQRPEAATQAAEPVPETSPQAQTPPSPAPPMTESAEPIQPAADDETPDEEPPAETLDANQIMRDSMALARASDHAQATSGPRRKAISASTREHIYAAYMRNWVRKVERVGNNNYPEQARRQNMEGSLILRVDIRADGSVARVELMRSSGHEVLDQAALRIVELAAPYAPLPPDIAAEVDILTLSRTWQFSSQQGWR